MLSCSIYLSMATYARLSHSLGRSFHPSTATCLLFTHIPAYPSSCLSIRLRLSICQSLACSLSLSLSVFLLIHPSTPSLSIHPLALSPACFTCSSICLAVNPPVCLVSVGVSLFHHPSICMTYGNN